MFESLTDLELSVESPDVAAYRIFDAEGSEFAFEEVVSKSSATVKVGWFNIVRILPMRVNCANRLSTAPQEFEAILRDNLLELGHSADALTAMSIHDMVSVWRSRFLGRG